MDIRNKRKRSLLKKLKFPAEPEDDCELAVAFRSYLSKKLAEAERVKQREARLKARREAKEKQLQREMEKKKREAMLQARKAKADKAKRGKGLTGGKNK